MERRMLREIRRLSERLARDPPTYSVSEAFGRKADLDDSFDEARVFYLSYGGVVLLAAAIVLIPGAPLIPILFLSQALNAVLLLVLLPFIRSLGKERALMGENALGRGDRIATGLALAVVAASVVALAAFSIA
jgi:Mn2+/Fe2+ NRAMP family transporter